MKVILNEYIENLGRVGDIIDVKPGYARNYLLPRKLAVHPTKHNMEVMKFKKVKAEIKLEEDKMTARELKEKLDALVITIEKKAGETDTLFGSVTTMEVQEKLEELGFTVERKRIHLKDHIKKLGEHRCKIKMIEEIEAQITIDVVREGGQRETITDSEETADTVEADETTDTVETAEAPATGEAEDLAQEDDQPVAPDVAMEAQGTVDEVEEIAGGNEEEQAEEEQTEEEQDEVETEQQAGEEQAEVEAEQEAEEEQAQEEQAEEVVEEARQEEEQADEEDAEEAEEEAEEEQAQEEQAEDESEEQKKTQDKTETED